MTFEKDKRFKQNINLWKCLFWAFFVAVTLGFSLLYYFGIVQFNHHNDITALNEVKMYRRSIQYDLSDWVKAAKDNVILPLNKENSIISFADSEGDNIVNDDNKEPSEKSARHNTTVKNKNTDPLSKQNLILTENDSTQMNPPEKLRPNKNNPPYDQESDTDDYSIGEEDENNDEVNSEEKKNGNDNKKEKKEPLTESQLLEFHSKAVKEIFAPNIQKNLEYFSSKSHLGGTPESTEMAHWIANKFKDFELDNVEIKKYSTLLSYPKEPGRLILFDKDGKEKERIVVIENKLDVFEKTTKFSIYPPYLAYSRSSAGEGEMIYANYGSVVDFRKLKKMNVDCNDKILLIRYGTIARNKKIKYAEECGAKGVILFSDPSTYSPTGVSYPDSWYLPPDGVMRGTLARRRGDALTRGYPAIDGLYKRPVEEVEYFPTIPVQPIGYGDAKKLLKTLDGLSPPSKAWYGGINVTYNVTSKDKRKVGLFVNVTKEIRNIHNVIGVIEGSVEPDRIVFLGNHRDAWGYGAADPSSGTAVMVEVARVLSKMKKEGWKPRRTILICSWDAEEFGLLGSTEWTEEYAKILVQQAVAYVNVDTAVQGNHTIELKSTPELVDVFFDATRRFKDPDSNENLYDSWLAKHKEGKADKRKEPKVSIFREGSDYMPFYGDLGIPSMDFRYMFDTDEQGVWNIPVYHTMHDNIAWMKKFVDPDFRYHATVAQVLTRVILLLADSTLLPFNLVRYSQNLRNRVERLDEVIKKEGLEDDLDIGLLKDSVKKLDRVTTLFHRNLQELDKEDKLAVRQVNDQMLLFERTFVSSEDLVEEDRTRHVYHTSGVLRAAFDAARSKNKSKKQYDEAVDNFKYKYSILTYHTMMSVHALENPFMKSKLKKEKKKKKKNNQRNKNEN